MAEAAEAAEVLGTTPTAIKLRVHRAYEAVRIVLVGDVRLGAAAGWWLLGLRRRPR